MWSSRASGKWDFRLFYRCNVALCNHISYCFATVPLLFSQKDSYRLYWDKNSFTSTCTSFSMFPHHHFATMLFINKNIFLSVRFEHKYQIIYNNLYILLKEWARPLTNYISAIIYVTHVWVMFSHFFLNVAYLILFVYQINTKIISRNLSNKMHKLVKFKFYCHHRIYKKKKKKKGKGMKNIKRPLVTSTTKRGQRLWQGNYMKIKRKQRNHTE